MSDTRRRLARNVNSTVSPDDVTTVRLPGLTAVTIDPIDRTITVHEWEQATDTPHHYTDDMSRWTLTDQRTKTRRGK
ncbi:MAG TPA: hypothetical protein VFV01_06950 [Spirillospora sp.]|nr:hypothetical protein [Spirillospora sp.]